MDAADLRVFGRYSPFGAVVDALVGRLQTPSVRAFTVAALALIAPVPCAAQATELAELQASLLPAFAESPALREAAPGRLRFEMELSEPLEHQVFTLDGPDRLVVDFPDLDWRLSDRERDAVATAGLRHGVSGLRVGLFSTERARLVFDLDGPATVLRHASVPGSDTAPAKFIIEFAIGSAVAVSPAPLPASIREAAMRAGLGAPSEAPAAEAWPFAPVGADAPRKRPRATIIALDPGHGGKDPGASYGGVSEKWLTLTFAQELRRVLEQPGVFEVVLTRETDEFIALADRVTRARNKGADLFISIHADALPANSAVSGASVYTLSDRSSDTLAAALARRENAADALAGVELKRHNDDIRAILVDLAKTRTVSESHRFAEVLIDSMQSRVKVLERRPHRQAGFRVLKTFDTPSALVELGFLTNLRDRRRLTNPAWREQAALAMAEAIRRWAAGERPDLREAVARR
ncbi:MAG: N-acetylmuramoyl-L-alanine amidase [Pseudomonadota bacterium]